MANVELKALFVGVCRDLSVVGGLLRLLEAVTTYTSPLNGVIVRYGKQRVEGAIFASLRQLDQAGSE